MSLNALDALKHSGIIIASDTAEYLNLFANIDKNETEIGEFFPQDATTNPSLVFAAISKPQYAHLVDEAVEYALSRPGPLEAQTELACDYLLVQLGIQILNIIPGRVSVSVDPRIAYDKDAIVAKGRTLISIFEELGYPRARVLVKIPATYPGILASQILETPPPTNLPIHTNATLIFSAVQALACAQAGISVVSPFVGRVKDWWDARGGAPRSEHPGIRLVRDIRAAYAAHGYTTRVMAAGFRAVEEVIEAGRDGREGGPDVMTLQPELLNALRERDGWRAAGTSVRSDFGHAGRAGTAERRYVVSAGDGSAQAEKAFLDDLEKEGIAVEKVPEGLAKFAVDAEKLQNLLREKIKLKADV